MKTPEQLERGWKRFKKKRFAGKEIITGVEMQQAYDDYLKKCKLTKQDLINLKQ